MSFILFYLFYYVKAYFYITWEKDLKPYRALYNKGTLSIYSGGKLYQTGDSFGNDEEVELTYMDETQLDINENTSNLFYTKRGVYLSYISNGKLGVYRSYIQNDIFESCFPSFLPNENAGQMVVSQTDKKITSVSFVNEDYRGVIIFVRLFKELYTVSYTNEKFEKMKKFNFDCKFSYAFSCTICFYSSDGKTVYFSKFGYQGLIKRDIIETVSEEPEILEVKFAILNDMDKNEDVTSDVAVACYTETKIYLYVVNLKKDIFLVGHHTVESRGVLDGSFSSFEISAFDRNQFGLVIDSNTLYLFDKSLTQTNVKGQKINNANSITLVKSQSDENTIGIILDFSSPEDNKFKAYFISYNLLKCQSLTYSFYLFNYQVDVSDLLVDLNTDGTKKDLKFIITSLPEKGKFIGKDKSNKEITPKLLDYSTDLAFLTFYGEDYGIYPVKFFFTEKLLSSFYLPSSFCTIKYILDNGGMEHCNTETSVYIYGFGCIKIHESLELQMGLHNSQYYSMYISMFQTSFSPIINKIFPLLNTFKAKVNNNTIPIVINGIRFSFYLFHSEDEQFLISNATRVFVPKECLEKIRTNYSLSSDEEFFIGHLDIKVQNYLPTVKTEFNVYDSKGNPYSITCCLGRYVGASGMISAGAKGSVFVYFPFIFLGIDEYTKLGSELLLKNNVDIFDAEEEYFNKNCFALKNPGVLDGKDVPYSIRKDVLYSSVSLCTSNCTYDSIDYINERTYCDCSRLPEIAFPRTIKPYEMVIVQPSTLGTIMKIKQYNYLSIYKCYQVINDNIFKNENLSMYFTLIVFVINIALFSFYLMFTRKKIKDRIEKLSRTFMEPSFIGHKCQDRSSVQSGGLNRSISGVPPNTSNDNILLNQSKSKSLKSAKTFDSNGSVSGSNDYFMVKYWDYLKLHHIIISLIFGNSKFIRVNVKYIFFFMQFMTTFFFNTILYSESYLKENYYSEKSINSINYILSNQSKLIFSSFFFTIILQGFLFYLCFGFIKLDYVARKVKNKDAIILEMERADTKFKIYFFLSLVLLGIFFYFTCIFCAIYYNTQTNLVLTTITTFIIEMIYPFISCGILSFFLLLSQRMESNRLKMFIKFINLQYV